MHVTSVFDCLFHTHFTFRINKEKIYNHYICQCCGKIGVFFRVKKLAFCKKRVVFQHQYQWNRGRFFTSRTLVCPMFYMRVKGPGLKCNID